VWRQDLVELLANVLAALGTERAWVVHGEDGLDEITLSGKTFVAEANAGNVKAFEISPEDFGLWLGTLDHLRGGDAQMNAEIIRDVFSGKRRDEARALVVVNAAAALYVGGKAQALDEAAALAEQSIDNGAAAKKLDELIAATNRDSVP
jgi:anthranilate phosphoribosyltransferase